MAHNYYASDTEFNEFRNRGFKVVRRWKDCYEGETVDIHSPEPWEISLTATVTEVTEKKCLLEVW